MGRKFGFSFSARRALGISSALSKIARSTGVPTSRSGMERKIGRTVMGGCAGSIMMFLLVVGVIVGVVCWVV
ncbi:MAG: hypothetical protein WCO98_12565 [bacterium]